MKVKFNVKIKMISFFASILILLNFGNVINGQNNLLSTISNDEKKFHCENGTLLSSSVCIPMGYIKGEAPRKPTIVRTKIEINNIREVNDKKMQITIDFYQEITWTDNRIKTTLAPNSSSCLNNNLINSIWKPDLWIKNLFDFKLRGVLEPTGGLIIKDESLIEVFFTTVMIKVFYVICRLLSNLVIIQSVTKIMIRVFQKKYFI